VGEACASGVPNVKWALSIAGRPPTVNTIMKMVPHARSDAKAPWRDKTKECALTLMTVTRPVTVTATPHLRGRRRQDVGACYLIVKACIDGLTDAGCWPDDDDEHVVALTFHPAVYGCAEDFLLLTITEVE
jgi:hypothetical protein